MVYNIYNGWLHWHGWAPGATPEHASMLNINSLSHLCIVQSVIPSPSLVLLLCYTTFIMAGYIDMAELQGPPLSILNITHWPLGEVPCSNTWWSHNMETLSTLLGNFTLLVISWGHGWIALSRKGPVMKTFEGSFVVSLKLLNKWWRTIYHIHVLTHWIRVAHTHQ